jgi:hypothetical protein
MVAVVVAAGADDVDVEDTTDSGSGAVSDSPRFSASRDRSILIGFVGALWTR